MKKPRRKRGEDREDFARMTTAELEELLRADFQDQEAGTSDMSTLFRAAQTLAEREPPSGSGAPDADLAWERFREKYLPFQRDGSSLYEDAEALYASAAAVQPPQRERPRPMWRGIAAAVLLAVFLSGGLLLAVDQEARAAFTGWVRELYEGDSIVYQYNGREDAPADGEEEPFYAPAWIPERYQLMDVTDVDGLLLAYADQEGWNMTLYCLRTDSGVLSIYDTEPEKRDIQGKAADFYPAREEGYASALIWEDGEKLFWLTGFLTEEEIVRVAESVQIMPRLQPPHRPAWFPEDYVEFVSSSGTGRITTARRNAEGQELRYSCAPGEDAERLQEELDASVAGLTPEEVQAGERPARLYRGEDGINHLVWSDGDGRLYWLYGSEDSEVLIRIAESVP